MMKVPLLSIYSIFFCLLLHSVNADQTLAATLAAPDNIVNIQFNTILKEK